MLHKEEITMKSDHVKKGMQQAPHRSLFNALDVYKRQGYNTVCFC